VAFLQITDLRFNTFNIVHPDLRLLNPTAVTKKYVTCKGLHITGIIQATINAARRRKAKDYANEHGIVTC
jgi:hypothetical protein